MSKPRISVITVCFNSAGTIRDTLESVAGQSYKDIEHIVIDGASTDGTLAILHEWHMHELRLVSQPDEGIYDAMNKGLALATGDVIGFLNADDIYAGPDILEDIASLFEKQNADVCYGDLVYVKQFDTARIARYWKSCDYKANLFRSGWIPPHPTFFARRPVYETHGNFDLRFRLAADFELMLRFMTRDDIKPVYLPKVLVRMRLGGATNRSFFNVVKQNVEIFRAGRKHNSPISPLRFVSTKAMNRMIQFTTLPADETK